MQFCGHLWVKTTRKLLFIKKGPQFSRKLSASNACMLATCSMSADIQSTWRTTLPDGHPSRHWHTNCCSTSNTLQPNIHQIYHVLFFVVETLVTIFKIRIMVMHFCTDHVVKLNNFICHYHFWAKKKAKSLGQLRAGGGEEKRTRNTC